MTVRACTMVGFPFDCGGYHVGFIIQLCGVLCGRYHLTLRGVM